MGFPASVHVLVAVAKFPSAASFKSGLAPGTETPAVVGSTTTMSFAVAALATLVSAIDSSEAFGGATTRLTALDFELSGFCICTLTVPAAATSAGAIGAVHSPV